MASRIARTSEYMTVTVVLLLAFSCLVSACSSAPPETTGSIASSRAAAPANPPPPVIHAAASTPVGRPVAAVAPRETCTCGAQARYDRAPTGSIPRSTAAVYIEPRPVRRTAFLVHTIEPNDTLYSISRRYRTHVADILAVNRLDRQAKLHSGELLVVPQTIH